MIPKLAALPKTTNDLAAGAKISTSAASALAVALNGANKAQIGAVAGASMLSKEQFKLALNMAGLTGELRGQAWKEYNLALKKLGASTQGVTIQGQKLKDVLSGVGTVLKAHPIIILGAALAGAALVMKKLYDSATQYKKALSDLAEEQEQLQSDVESLQSQYDSNLSTLKELEAIEAPTLAEQSEIDKLKEANAQLKMQIQYKQQLANESKQSTVSNFVKAYQEEMTGWTTRTGDIVTDETGNTSTVSRSQEEEIAHQFERLAYFKKQTAEATAKAMQEADADERQQYQDLADSYQEYADDYRSKLEKTISGLEDMAKNVDYGLDPQADAFIDQIKELRYQLTMVGADAETAAAVVNGIFAETRFSEAKNAIQNAFSEYGTTFEEAKAHSNEFLQTIQNLYATNPKVKLLIDLLYQLGILSPDPASWEAFAAQLYGVEDAADAAAGAVDSLTSISDATDKLVSATETLRNAQEELSKGYLSSSTLKSMQENIAGMDEIIVKYKLGMVTAQQVYAEYKRLYEADKANFKSQNALKLGLTEEFFNKSVKGNANYTKILGTYYTSDLGNFKELAQKKLEIDTKLQKTLGENWADYFSTYAQAVTASSFSLMSEAEYNKKYPHGDYAAYQLINVSENRVSSAQLSQYKELLAVAEKFDDFAKQVNSDLNIKIPQLSGGSSSSGSSKSTTETKKSMDEVYADLKALQEETERQNDRLSNMTQDTTAEQISLWYNLRKEAIKQLNQITDHTSEAYRYVEDIVKDCNSNISSLYDDQLDALDKIIDMTEDMLKKEADDQVDALEDQVDKYKEIVELKKKLLEQSSDEEDYEKKVAKLTKEIADIQESIGQLDLEIKSNPNDSRKAQAEQQKLMQSLKDKQDELYDLQRDHYKDSLTSRLDDEADAFEKSKQDEIDKIKETVDDDKKLHQKAIDYIDKNWDDLYNQLSKYAKDQGRDVEKELTKAWDVAKDAVDAYGGSILDAMDSIEKMQSMIQSTNKEGNYNQLGELAGNPQLMAIVKAMKKNSTDYLATSDPTTKKNIKQSQAALVKQFEAISGHQLAQGSDGTWYLDKVGGETVYSHFGVGDVVNPNRPSGSTSGGTKNPYSKPSNKQVLKSGSSGSNVAWVQTQLNKAASKDGNSAFKVSVDSKYGAKTEAAVRAFQRAKGLSADGQVGPKTLALLERYHKGGIVGGNATLKDNEMLAVLEKNETILTKSMWKNLTEKLNAVQDFIQSSLPVIDKFPAGTVPAYAGAGGMNIAPVINVQFEHHGDFDEKAAKKFASQISDFTIQQIKKNQQTHRYRK